MAHPACERAAAAPDAIRVSNREYPSGSAQLTKLQAGGRTMEACYTPSVRLP